MLGLGANISGGSPVGIVGAAPPSDYIYESDFTTDLFFNTSVSGSVVDHEGRSDVYRYFNNVDLGFFSRNTAVPLGPGSYEIDFWYYVPSGSNFEKLSVYKNTGSTEILSVSEVQYDQWVNLTHNFNIDKATYLFFIGRASGLNSGDCIFLSDVKVSLNIATSPSPPPGGYYEGALDQSSFSYVGAAAAYSLRLVYSYYDGPAIRVRRASDNAEQDIGFSNGVLDTSTLSTFCSGTNGFAKVWYDQSGNGIDAVQATTANQPKVYDSSTGVVTDNGKPAVAYDSTDLLQAALAISHVPLSVFIVQSGPSTQADIPFDLGNTASATEHTRLQSNAGASKVQQLLARSVADGLAAANISDNFDQGLITIISKAVNDRNIGMNGSAFVNLSTSVTTIDSNFLKLGGQPTEEIKQQDVIIYPSDQSTNRAGIETNINDFYTIY